MTKTEHVHISEDLIERVAVAVLDDECSSVNESPEYLSSQSRMLQEIQKCGVCTATYEFIEETRRDLASLPSTPIRPDQYERIFTKRI